MIDEPENLNVGDLIKVFWEPGSHRSQTPIEMSVDYAVVVRHCRNAAVLLYASDGELACLTHNMGYSSFEVIVKGNPR